MISKSVIDGFDRSNNEDDLGWDFRAVIPPTFFTNPESIRAIQSLRGNPWFLLEAISFREWQHAVTNCQQVWTDLLGNIEGNASARIHIHDRLNDVRQHFPALRCSLEWLEYMTMGRVSPSVIDIARYQNQGGQSILAKMWSGSESLIQTHLLRKHRDDVVWPSSPLFCRAWTVFSRCGLPEVIRILTDSSSIPSGVFWGDYGDHRYMVVNLPVLLGIWSMNSVPMTWWHRKRRIAVVEQVRAFDPQWFDVAYQHGVMLAIVLGVQYTPIQEVRKT